MRIVEFAGAILQTSGELSAQLGGGGILVLHYIPFKITNE